MKLQHCLYQFDSGSYNKLIAALKEGKMNNQSTTLSSEEIHNLRHSKNWNSYYSKYVKKVIHDGERICSELELFHDWLKEFVKENDGLLLTSLEKFKCQIECNKVNAQFIGDPSDAEVYV